MNHILERFFSTLQLTRMQQNPASSLVKSALFFCLQVQYIEIRQKELFD